MIKSHLKKAVAIVVSKVRVLGIVAAKVVIVVVIQSNQEIVKKISKIINIPSANKNSKDSKQNFLNKIR